MLNRHPFALVSFSLAAVFAASMVTSLTGQERNREAVSFVTKSPRIDQFDKYFALSIKPDRKDLPPRADAHDIVFIVDTSASQIGDFRDRSWKTLEVFLKQLNPGDRVRLLAVDINAVPMTDSFVAPDGKEMAAALQKLRRRVPLGLWKLCSITVGQ